MPSGEGESRRTAPEILRDFKAGLICEKEAVTQIAQLVKTVAARVGREIGSLDKATIRSLTCEVADLRIANGILRDFITRISQDQDCEHHKPAGRLLKYQVDGYGRHLSAQFAEYCKPPL